MKYTLTFLLGSDTSGTLARQVWLCPLKGRDGFLGWPLTPKTPNYCGLPDNMRLCIMVHFFRVNVAFSNFTVSTEGSTPSLRFVKLQDDVYLCHDTALIEIPSLEEDGSLRFSPAPPVTVVPRAHLLCGVGLFFILCQLIIKSCEMVRFL